MGEGQRRLNPSQVRITVCPDYGDGRCRYRSYEFQALETLAQPFECLRMAIGKRKYRGIVVPGSRIVKPLVHSVVLTTGTKPELAVINCVWTFFQKDKGI